MFKGFFAGLASGVAVSAVMIVVANEMAVRPEVSDTPQAAAVELPVGSAFDAVRSDLPPVVPGAGGAGPNEVAPAGAPRTAGPEALPATTGGTGAPMVPVAGAEAPIAGAVPGTPPADPASLASQPDSGPRRSPAAALTARAPDSAPVPVAPVAAPVNVPTVGIAAAAPVEPQVQAPPAPVLLGGGGDVPPALQAPTGRTPEPPTTGVQLAANGAFTGPADDQPLVAPPSRARPEAPTEIAALDAPAADGAVALPRAGVPAVLPAAPGVPAQPGAAPGPGLADGVVAPAPLNDDLSAPQDLARQIPTGRLPQAGLADAAAPAPTGDPAGVGAQPDDAPPEDALTRNAAEFTADADLPVLSIVLLDGAGLPLELPFQASFVLDPLLPDALDRAGAYRAAGHEILVLPRLPEGASARDAAQAIEGSRALLDQAVALIDSPEGALQVSRDALAEVVVEAAAEGLGLLTFPRGLNSAQRVAQKQGVVTGVVFRDIDGAGQDASAVGRFLDQAAFRARQEGAVIVFARVRQETLAGLAEWVLGNRAQSVTLAPVSVALKAGAGL